MRLKGPGHFGLVETNTDLAALHGSATVRLSAGGVCGSDKPGFLRGHAPDGRTRPGYPLHECVGTVVSAPGSDDLVGCRVVAIPENDDGMREEFTAPMDKVHPLSSTVEQLPDEIAVLIQPLATVLAGADALGDVDGNTAVVLGLGPIGLMFGHILRRRGARRVIGVDTRPRVGCPLSRCFDEIHRAPHQIGDTMDVCVEAAGHQQDSLAAAIELTRMRGRILAFGVPDDDHYAFPYKRFFRKSLTLIASVQPSWQQYLPLAESYLLERQTELAALVTHTYAVTEAQAAFTTAFGPDTPRAQAVGKVVLVNRGRPSATDSTSGSQSERRKDSTGEAARNALG